MEENSLTNLSSTPQGSNTQSTPTKPVNNEKLKKIVSIIIILLFIIGATAAGYVLGKDSRDNKNEDEKTDERYKDLDKARSCEYEGKTYISGEGFNSTDGCNTCGCENGNVVCTQKACEPETDTTPQPDSISNIPEGWSTRIGSQCNVTFPIPPKESPFFINAPGEIDDQYYWQFKEQAINDLDPLSLNYIYYALHIGDSTLGSGYVSGLVNVKCLDNTLTGRTLNQTMDVIKNYYDSLPTIPEDPSLNLVYVDLGSETKWGVETRKYKLTGGMENSEETRYVFIKNNILYEVSVLGMSQREEVRTTANKIFDNLIFGN